MSYADVRHHYEDPPDEQDLKDAEVRSAKDFLKQATGVDVAALMEMEYSIETKSTDGVGGWSDWEEVARFLYPEQARRYVRHVQSYQGEEAQIDRVQIRAMYRGQELTS